MKIDANALRKKRQDYHHDRQKCNRTFEVDEIEEKCNAYYYAAVKQQTNVIDSVTDNFLHLEFKAKLKDIKDRTEIPLACLKTMEKFIIITIRDFAAMTLLLGRLEENEVRSRLKDKSDEAISEVMKEDSEERWRFQAWKNEAIPEAMKENSPEGWRSSALKYAALPFIDKEISDEAIPEDSKERQKFYAGKNAATGYTKLLYLMKPFLRS